MKLFSPAKLNLFFRVLKKREDGFHEIASLMQAISLGDILTFEEGSRDSLTSSNPLLPCDQTNFIHKARALFRNKTGYATPVCIHVEKEVPMEGGLGGGSGNIATTLWALREMSGLPIEESDLRAWAGKISSDAPFFFSSGTAYTTGRGEIVEDKKPLPARNLWLALPEGEGLSTPLVYKHCRSNIHDIDPRNLLQTLSYVNDLEYSAFKLRPDLAEVKEELISLGFDHVCMTGSGTTFFCLGDITPSLPGVRFIQTAFVSRRAKWFEFPSQFCGELLEH